MLYHPPTGSTDPNAPYVGKNVAAGIQGSKVPPGAVEMTQRELVNLITQSGQTPTDSDPNQVTRAVRGGQLDFDATDTGTADAVSCQISLPHPQVKAGLPFTFIKGPNANATTTPTLTITDLAGNNGITGPIVRANGKPPAAGDLPGGSLVTVRADTQGAFRVTSLVPSDIALICGANGAPDLRRRHWQRDWHCHREPSAGRHRPAALDGARHHPGRRQYRPDEHQPPRARHEARSSTRTAPRCSAVSSRRTHRSSSTTARLGNGRGSARPFCRPL